MPQAWSLSGRGQRGGYSSLATDDGGRSSLQVGDELQNPGKDYRLQDDEAHHHDVEDGTTYAIAPLLASKGAQIGGDEDPTAEELSSLPHVSDKLPWSAFLVAIVELCERFAYYGLSNPFQNYISNSYNDPNGLPGALGLQQARATALSNFFQAWCYITPVFGAMIADQYLGKYRTIKYFMIIYMVGIFILFVTSLPVAIKNGIALPGLVTAMIIIGIGTGGIKSNVSPLIAEQVTAEKPVVRVEPKTGARVVVDPKLTLSSVYMMFYLCINLGSISAIATTILELRVGFWSAYLLPLVAFCIGFIILLAGRKRYVIRPPEGGVIGKCFRALWIAATNGFDLDKAKPSVSNKRRGLNWDERFVEELRTALVACRAFLFFPVYWLTYSQMMNNFISQAGQMELHSLPNDILPNINPVTIILLIPLMDRIIYPFIRNKLHTSFGPTSRITLGFLVAALAMAYASVLQSFIYASPPCYSRPSACVAGQLPDPEGKKFLPNQIHVAWQIPAYMLIATSEVLASVTGLELAYAKAPADLKSFVMSLFLLTSAFGSAGGILISPFARDPYLGWVYAGLACLAAAAGALFWWCFRGSEEEDEAQRVRRVEVADVVADVDGEEIEMSNRSQER